MRYPNGRLVVMAKAPIAGLAKTRLIPALGADGAATLQRYFVERQIVEALSADLSPLELWCAGDYRHSFFLECQQHFGVALRCQQGQDLGDRLQHALESALHDAEFAIVIGCDIPELNAAVLSKACEAMQQGADAVIAPVEDGGYALLGLRHAEPHLFSQIEWGSDKVMAQTRERLERLDWHWHELPELWDLDRPEDLPRLMRLDTLPAAIGRMLDEAASITGEAGCLNGV